MIFEIIQQATETLFLKAIRYFEVPWLGVMFARGVKGCRPYFGLFLRKSNGPDLKLINLKKRFGNCWLRVNLIYVVSGIPPPLLFLRWAKFWGAKIVINQNGWHRKPAETEKSQSKHILRNAFPWILEARNNRLRKIHALADYQIFQSGFCLKESLKNKVRVGDCESEIIYNPVDLSRFHPINDVEVKHIEFFYGDNERFKKFEFYKILYKMESDNFMNNVCERFNVPNEKMPSVYRNHHIFVDRKQNDPCPNSVLEAMACGLPVVYHNSGGTKELVGDAGIGFSDINGFTMAIGIIRLDYKTFRSRAIERAKLFDIEKWYRRHEEIFRGMIN